MQKVKDAIDWAYRSGYFFAEEAGRELAEHLGEELGKESLGQYGDTLTWTPKPALAREEE